jgi:hypothetical protein
MHASPVFKVVYKPPCMGGKATFSYIEACKLPQRLEMEVFVWEEKLH